MSTNAQQNKSASKNKYKISYPLDAMIKQIKDKNDTRKKNLFLEKEGKIFFDTVYHSQKIRIFNALKNSEPDSVVKFKDVLSKIINGK